MNEQIRGVLFRIDEGIETVPEDDDAHKLALLSTLVSRANSEEELQHYAGAVGVILARSLN